ncbi:hypothetical protein BLNAU_21148 [Blattamonas nauphoetae]|uniref:Uncharacterized protein n=1 Tax=Blattamonas nauphoetae TaxID=2049346 RepID=A0ABQ9X0X6_9EUKA|nr:hypothetical protein BLNAU_21148 [Blattamonas nauphoetae]
MIVLISSASQPITTATIEMLRTLIIFCSPKHRLALFKADLIPQLITTLHPQSLPFAETEDIHACLISNITSSFWLATPDSLTQLRIKDRNEQQAVHKTKHAGANKPIACIILLLDRKVSGMNVTITFHIPKSWSGPPDEPKDEPEDPKDPLELEREDPQDKKTMLPEKKTLKQQQRPSIHKQDKSILIHKQDSDWREMILSFMRKDMMKIDQPSQPSNHWDRINPDPVEQ